MAFPSALGNSTTRQLFGRMPSSIIPLGYTRRYGPHSTFGMDTRVAAAVAERLDGDWLLAPAIFRGAEGEQEAPRGAVSVGAASPLFTLAEPAPASPDRASLSVFAGDHAGNIGGVAVARGSHRDNGRRGAASSCAVARRDVCSGHTETALPLDISTSELAPAAELVPRLRRGNVAGHVTLVTAVDGVSRITAWAPTCRGNLR